MTRILVTGSSGFIGRHLIRDLVASDYDVVALDIRPPADSFTSPRLQYRTVDMLQADALVAAFGESAPDAVIHLAARTDLRETADINGYAVNFTGVENLVAAIRATPSVRRCICTATQLVNRLGYKPTSDTDYNPDTLYGASKVKTEQVWRAHDGGGVEWCLVRPTTIWGPYMNPHYLTFYRMIRDGRYFHVRKATRKSFGYVGNTIYQYKRLLTAPKEALHRKTLYVADYEPIILEQWAERFRVALDAPRIWRLPYRAARLGARVGDLLNRAGFQRFPFNSFRLKNVSTEFSVDLSLTRQLCGDDLPVSQQAAVDATAAWLRTIWGADHQR